MSVANQCLPAWQQVSEPVSDIQMYPYLVRLAVVAIKLNSAMTAKKEEAMQLLTQDRSKESVTISKLPKGTMKSMMSYFKQLALDKQPEPIDAALKRAYLAFYAQLLDIKSKEPGGLEDFSQTAELLIAKFLANVTKVSGPASVEYQGTQFVLLIRSLARKNGGTSQLDSQLANLQNELKEKAQKKPPSKPVKGSDTDGIADEIARIMLVSPTLFERDVAQYMDVSLDACALSIQQLEEAVKSHQHPAYQVTDFQDEKDWDEFCASELRELGELKQQFPPPPASASKVPDLVPPNVRAYFSAFLKRCIESDLKASTLLNAKTKKLITFVSQFWRINSKAYVSCMLHAVNGLYSSKAIDLNRVVDSYDYLEHTLESAGPVWALPDSVLATDSTDQLRDILIKEIRSGLDKLFTPEMPKLGPHLQLVEQTIPSLASHWQGPAKASDTTFTKEITPLQYRQINKVIVQTAEREYVRLVSLLPRDASLDVQHILDFVQTVIGIARKLQKKYRMPIFGKISIARSVCSHQLKLLFSDFVPIYEYCMKQHSLRKETPPFDIMVALHDELDTLQDLQTQLQLNKDDEPDSFDPEALLFPYFKNWAIESAEMSREWVKPVIEQDDNTPIDPSNGKMYSTAVKDLFDSFYSCVSLIEKHPWNDPYYAAKLLTIVISGISAAICDWSAQTFLLFLQEIRPIKLKPGLKAKESDEQQWLTYAREATAQATAAVMATRVSRPIETFDLKPESGVKINNIAVAYDMLHQMESRLQSDEISKQIQTVERRERSKSKAFVYLFTLTVISASGVDQGESGLYVTLVDQDSRKQVGKTSTAYGSGRGPSWNEPVELEVSLNRPKLLKATLWRENQHTNHDLLGKAMLRLDPSQFGRREYGTQLKWVDLEPGSGKLQVMLAIDLLQDDIRFHFGKSLRFLKRTQDTMINTLVKQFSDFIHAIISRQTLREVTGSNSLATSVQSSVNQLQKSFNMWLGKASPGIAAAAGANTVDSQSAAAAANQDKAADDCLVPLYDYLNKNFAVLAGILTPELRIEVLSGVWDVVLEALELLIIPPLDYRKTTQTPLTSAEMEVTYSWLSSLREFFHSGGAGPSLERLQSQNYQQIMAIPVYYDLPASQLKIDCEKVVKSSLGAIAGNQELMARQRTVMAHRNKSIIEHQAIQLRKAQRSTPLLDDVILRILRLRGEYAFIEQHLKYRERLLQREMTERALQGSVF